MRLINFHCYKCGIETEFLYRTDEFVPITTPCSCGAAASRRNFKNNGIIAQEIAETVRWPNAELNPWVDARRAWRQKYDEIASLYGRENVDKWEDVLAVERLWECCECSPGDGVLFDGPCPHPEYLGIWDDGGGRGVRVTWDGVSYTAAPCRSDDTSLTFLNVLNAKPSEWAPPDEWVLIEPAAPESAEPYEPKPKMSMRIPWDPYPDGVA